MAIPDYQSLMLPLLRHCADGKTHTMPEAVAALAREFGLSDAELAEALPSGGTNKFHSRVGWARTYLGKANLLETVSRGCYRLTQRGKDVLTDPPSHIDNHFLQQFDEFKVFKAKASNKDEAVVPLIIDSTPDELLEAGYKQLRETLAAELLQQVKQGSPAFFERLVVELLVRMGYGGTREDAGQVLGKSGDGGIDGIINEDRLGLDVIYLQAKRWEGDVGRPEIQKFVGALAGHKANKGVFLTTSGYSKEARVYAGQVNAKLVLIDGPMLAELMIDYGLGVATVTSYEIKRVDSDYFAED